MSNTIVRGIHDKDNPYYVASRTTAQDVRLSYEALGLLTYLLSKPDNWEVQIDDLIRPGCGRDKAYGIVAELKTAGYLTREKKRNAKGQWQWEPYRLFETPQAIAPDTEEPYTGKPDTEKPEIKALNTEQQNTEIHTPTAQAREAEVLGAEVDALTEDDFKFPLDEPGGSDPRPTDDVAWGLGMSSYPRRYGRKADRARQHPLVQAWRAGFPVDERPPVDDAHLEIAERMAALGYQPADVTALTVSKLPDKPGYPLRWCEQDMPVFLAQKNAPDKPATPKGNGPLPRGNPPAARHNRVSRLPPLMDAPAPPWVEVGAS